MISAASSAAKNLRLFVLDHSLRLLAVFGFVVVGGGLLWLEVTQSNYGYDYRLPDTKISYDVHDEEAGSVYHFQIEAVPSKSIMTDACLSNQKEGKKIKIDYPGLQRTVTVFWQSDGNISVEKTDTTGNVIFGEDDSKIKRLAAVLDQVLFSYECCATIDPALLNLLFAEGRDSSAFWTWRQVPPKAKPVPPENRGHTFTASCIHSRKPARIPVAQAFKPASFIDERVLFSLLTAI